MTESVEFLNARVSLAVNGRTLSDLLAQQKRLAFSTVVDYLDQLSEAIDIAHEQGFIHRNIKPSTILLTAEGRVVLPDLGSGGRSFQPADYEAVGAPAPLQAAFQDSHDRKDPRSRSYRREARWASYKNTRLMTFDYMAPEQILERDVLSPEARRVSDIAGMDRTVDGRADLYSLGVVLYQMVTGILPFRAEMPEQVALKHLRMPPPSPQQLRPDLPIAAEQAMLRALAKRPADRYVRAQDLATAFRVALMAADIQLDDYQYVETESSPEDELVAPSPFIAPDREAVEAKPRWSDGLVPTLQAEVVTTEDNDLDEGQSTNPVPVVNAVPSSSTDNAITPMSPLPPAAQEASPAEAFSGAWAASVNSFVPLEPAPTNTGAQSTIVSPDQRSAAERISDQRSAAEHISINPISPLPATNTSGMVALSNFQQGNTGTLKLTGPAKIVQVPVAGQPGLYMTGLLPVFPQQPSPSGTLASTPLTQGGQNKGRIIFTLAMVVMLLVFGSGLFWFIHIRSSQPNRQITATVTPNLKATASVRALAVANANAILIDPLSQNIHNWPIATTGSMIYVFENDAYHITDNNPTEGAPAILRDEILQGSFAYTLTMEEIRGDDTSINNEFGMIIRANSQNKNGKIITTFYSFEVLNTKSGEYQFWKYDNSKGSSVTPWTKLWHHSFGKEFHEGHGPGSINTFKIFVNGKSFTLIVNGKQIATVQDNSCSGSLCSSGGIGMLVNLKGTEVAFSNLRLTHS